MQYSKSFTISPYQISGVEPRAPTQYCSHVLPQSNVYIMTRQPYGVFVVNRPTLNSCVRQLWYWGEFIARCV